jgi:quercetin dioxygenase-like cupin family protein
VRVVRTAEVQQEPAASALFTGDVTRQAVVPANEANSFNCGIVNFGRGARNKFHTHSSDQILIVTSGIGIVATQDEEREVGMGDIVHIPAGESHWHGARRGSPMSHISITGLGSQTAQQEE